MSYLRLNDERLLSVIDGLNRVLAAPLDPEAVAETGGSVAVHVTGADGAVVTFHGEDALRRVEVGDTDGSHDSLEVDLKHPSGSQGTLLVVKRTGAFDEADLEALRLVSEGLSAQLDNASLHSMATRESRVDVLTGLGNALAFEERLEWELSRSQRYGDPLSVAMFGLDDYISLQDRFGPRGIDEIVIEVGEVLSQGRAADSCFRISSDRFAVLMPNTDVQGAEIAAIRMAWQIANLRDADGTITASSGVHQADAPDVRTFVAEAEAALERQSSLLGR